MALSKKNYEAIAKILREETAAYHIGSRDDLIHAFADYFGSDNPRFDRGRFIDEATKVEGERN